MSSGLPAELRKFFRGGLFPAAPVVSNTFLVLRFRGDARTVCRGRGAPRRPVLRRSQRLPNDLRQEQLQRDPGLASLAAPVLRFFFRGSNGSQRSAANVTAGCRPTTTPHLLRIVWRSWLATSPRPCSSTRALGRVEVSDRRLLRLAHLKKSRLRNKSTALTRRARRCNLRGAKTTATIRRYDHRLEPNFPHRWPTSVWWVVFANSRQAVERLRWGLFCPQRLQDTQPDPAWRVSTTRALGLDRGAQGRV